MITPALKNEYRNIHKNMKTCFYEMAQSELSILIKCELWKFIQTIEESKES